RRVDGDVQVRNERRRRITGLEGGRVDKRLECRPGLPARLRGAIEAALVEVAAADERAHRAGTGIEGHQRALQIGETVGPGARRRGIAVAALDADEAVLDALLRRLRQRRIDRRVAPHPALDDAGGAETLEQLPPHLLLEVEAEGL